MTKTLSTLIAEFSAEGFVYADAGNGSAFGKRGQFVRFDDEAAAKFSDVELSELAAGIVSEDGLACTFGSDWIDGDNGYRYRLLF